MPDEVPEFLRPFVGGGAARGGDDEPRSVSFGTLGPRPQIGLVLVDARGEPFGAQYAHLLYAYRRGECLVLRYTYGEVVLAGRGLTPATLPFALVIDEAQAQWSSCDAPYAALQRSGRGPLVLVTQGYESFLAEAEGGQAEARVNVLTSNLACKLFFRPTAMTCEWLCLKLLGTAKRVLHGGGTSTGGPQPPADFLGNAAASVNGSFSEQYTPLMVAEDFADMRTGSPADGGVADALALFPDGRPRWVAVRRLEG